MADELDQICILSSLIATGVCSLFHISFYQTTKSNKLVFDLVKVFYYTNNYELHIFLLIGLIINTLCYPLVAINLYIEFSLVYPISWEDETNLAGYSELYAAGGSGKRNHNI